MPTKRQTGVRSGAGLSRLIALAPPDFATTHWGRSPLISRAGELPAPFDDLLDHAGVDTLLSTRGLRTPFLRVAKDGVTRPERDFTTGGGIGAGVRDQISDDALLRLFAQGCTIVLQGLHRTWEPLLRLSQDLAAYLGHPVQVNAYVTPTQSTGFAAHYDVHDVFVLQIAGEKRWRLYPPVRDNPARDEPWTDHRDAVEQAAAAEPSHEVVLAPGDCLYLPRGWLHAASALDGVSTHVTIGVHTWDGGHIADALLATARRGLPDTLRASLPLGVDVTDSGTYDETIEGVRAALIRAVADAPAEAVAEALLAQHRAAQRPAPIAPVSTVEVAASIDEGRALSLRPHLAARYEDGVLRGRHGRTEIDPADEEVVRRLLDGETLTAPSPTARRLLLAGIAVLAD